MKSKLYSQKKRYVEGLKTCVIVMIILLIVTVAVTTLSSYVGQRSIDPSKFDSNIDIKKEFSVPLYSCPVEIDVSIRGGGNATFYLVKGKNLSDSPLEDAENAEYISNNTVAIETNTRNFHLERELDPGDYTLYVLHLQEKKNDEKPIIVGIDVEDDQAGATAYSSHSKVQYNKVNIFVLKPIMPYVYIVFIIGEILLIAWFFSFIVRRGLVREEAEPQPVSQRVRIEKVPKRNSTATWNATLRGEGGPGGPVPAVFSYHSAANTRKKSMALPQNTSRSSVISTATIPSEALTPNLPELTENHGRTTLKKDVGHGKKRARTGKRDKKADPVKREKQMSSMLEGLRNLVPTIENTEKPESTRKETSVVTEREVEEMITLDVMELDEAVSMDQLLEKVNEDSAYGKTRKNTVSFVDSLKNEKRARAYRDKKPSSDGAARENREDRNALDAEMEKLGKLGEPDPSITGESKDRREGYKAAMLTARERRIFPSDRKEKLEMTFARILKTKSDELPVGSKKQKKMDTLRDRMDSLLSQIIEE